MPIAQRQRLQMQHPGADAADLEAGEQVLVACVLSAGPGATSALRPALQAAERCNPLHGLLRVGTRRDRRVRREFADLPFDDLPQWSERVVDAWTPQTSIAGRYLVRALPARRGSGSSAT